MCRESSSLKSSNGDANAQEVEKSYEIGNLAEGIPICSDRMRLLIKDAARTDAKRSTEATGVAELESSVR